MKKNPLIKLSILVLFITVCCQIQKPDKKIPFVDVESNFNNMQKLYLSQFTDSVWYVPFQSNVNHLVRNFGSIDYAGNYILCSDGQLCILYDKEGHFIKQIGKQGRGPGEYTGISFVSFGNSKFFIYDFYADDLIEYDADGAFISKHKSGFTGEGRYRLASAIMLNDSMIFGNINITGRDELSAIIIDKQGNILNKFKNNITFTLKPRANYISYPEFAIINKSDNGIIFKDDFNDTVFKIDNDYRPVPYCIINLGKYQKPLSERRMMGSEMSDIKLKTIFQIKNYIVLVCDFFKFFPARRLTEKIVSVPGIKDYTSIYNTTLVLGIFDKRNSELVFSEPTSTDTYLFTSGLYNDIDAGPRFIPDHIANDSTLVMKVQFYRLVELLASDEFKKSNPRYPERKKRLEFFVDSLERTGFDNPLFMFVTFKGENK